MAIATLTVDLVAKLGNMQTELNRASHIAEKNAKKMEEAFAAVKGTVGTLFAGVAVGSAWQALIADTARLGSEISKLSQLSNTTVEDFQLMAYGAKTAGVEQDKLADILKDVNDKFGEFSVTGGGELKDFFDTVAAKVGVTADAFKNLSGPQALQLYYDTLKKANVSQQQATFFMEALANDATLLVPLLKDGGAGFKQMADEAQRFGVVMDSQAIASAKEFEGNMKRLDAAMTGLRATIGNAVIPEINRLTENFLDASAKGLRFGEIMLNIGGDTPWEDRIRAGRAELDSLNAALDRYKKFGGDTSGIEKAIDSQTRKIAYYESRVKSATKAMGGMLGLGDIDSAAAGPAFTPDAKPEKTKVDRSDPLGEWIKDIEAQLKPAEDAIKRFRDIQLDAAVAGADLTASQRAFYDIVNTPEWAAMSEPWQDLVRTEADLAIVAERAAAQQARLNELLGATDSARLEAARADMQLLADALEAGKISVEQFEEAASKALGLFAEKGVQEFDDLKQAIEGWGRDSAKTIASALTSGKGSLKDFGDFAKQILSDILAMQIYKNVTGPATKALGSVNWAAMFGFADGGVMTPAGPLPLRPYANGGIANSPQVALFGEGRMNEAFVPLPDGRTIPVTIKGQGEGMKSVKVEVINETSQPARAASATPRFDADGMVISIVLRDLNNNGPIRQALGG